MSDEPLPGAVGCSILETLSVVVGTGLEGRE